MQAGQECTDSPALPPGRPTSRARSATRARRENPEHPNCTIDQEPPIRLVDAHDIITTSTKDVPRLCLTEHFSTLPDDSILLGNGRINQSACWTAADRIAYRLACLSRATLFVAGNYWRPQQQMYTNFFTFKSIKHRFAVRFGRLRLGGHASTALYGWL